MSNASESPKDAGEAQRAQDAHWDAVVRRRGERSINRPHTAALVSARPSMKPKPSLRSSASCRRSRTVALRPAKKPKPPPTEEESAAMRLQYGVPTAIDRWLNGLIEASKVPERVGGCDWTKAGRSVDFLEEDSVQVIITVGEVVHEDKASPFVDDSAFTLYLKVLLPPSSGFLVYYHKSPTIIVDTYFGTDDDLATPDWVKYRKSPLSSLWMPRTSALEVLRLHSLESQNAKWRNTIQAWCHAATRGSFADVRKTFLTSAPSPPPPPPPPPLRRHWTNATFRDPVEEWVAQRDKKIGQSESPCALVKTMSIQ